MAQLQSNAGAWPASTLSRSRFQMDDGRIVEVTVYWHEIKSMARRALKNKTGQSTAGPVTVREVKA